MEVARASIWKTPFIGAYSKVFGVNAVVNKNAPQGFLRRLRDFLRIDSVAVTNISGVHAVSSMIAANSNFIVAPDTIEDEELRELESLGKEVLRVESKLKAWGNMMILSEKGVLFSPRVSKKEAGMIIDFLGIDYDFASLANYVAIGALAVPGEEVCFASKLLKEEEKKLLEDQLFDWETARENWIDVVAAPTGYLARVVNGNVEFEKTTISPLTGKQAHLLSRDAVNAFVCVEDGAEVGRLMGLDVPVTAKMDSMIRYHTGVFGFTGTGKSNLASVLIRKAFETVEGLRVVVFDVAGEYVVNLLDLLEKGVVFTTERTAVENEEEFVKSQTIPESLEEAVGAEKIEKTLSMLHGKGRVRRLVLTEPGQLEVGVEDVLNLLDSIISSGKPGAIAAKMALGRLTSFMEENSVKETDSLLNLAADPKKAEGFRSILEDFAGELHGMSSEVKAVNTVLRVLESTPGRTVVKREAAVNPERLAELIISEGAPGLTVVYAPNLVEARLAVSRYVDRLLELKKRGFSRVNVLTVLDEAQEFVPDRARREDATEQSNTAVETLLRQGRKYRAGCWLSTQRVAHLNVNALQQLHTYFTSTLPRFYDRMVIADAYSLDYEVLNRVAELDTGEWMFVSYKATKRRNVPVFVKTPNNEQKIIEHVKKIYS